MLKITSIAGNYGLMMIFEMIVVELKGRDPIFTWEIVGIYRAPNEDMRVIERLAARTEYIGNSTKRNITRVT